MKQVIPLNQFFDGAEQLGEAMTYAQLFNMTDSGRHARSSKVRGPPLEIYAGDRQAYHIFNFKAYPSTTGFRHRGYIAFKKPRNAQPQPSESLAVEVDCDCEDYRYRWAWANKQRGAGKVGPQSLNKSINRAPVITNPAGKPSLCKHLAAAKNFIWGLIQRFPSPQAPAPGEAPEPAMDVSWKIGQLVKKAQDRYDNYGARKQQAAQRMDVYRQAQIARNIQGPMPQADVPRGAEEELPVALPQDQPPVEQPEPPTPEPPVEDETKKRTESLVVRATHGKSMNTEALKKTKAIVEAMEDDLQAALGDEGGGAASDVPPPPGEGEGEMGEEPPLPPVTAGEDQPEDEALQLLRNISVGIDRLANELAPAEAPEGEEPEGEEPEGEEPEGEGDEGDGSVPPVEDDDDFQETMPVQTGA
jgi:hypothetical protein